MECLYNKVATYTLDWKFCPNYRNTHYRTWRYLVRKVDLRKQENISLVTRQPDQIFILLNNENCIDHMFSFSCKITLVINLASGLKSYQLSRVLAICISIKENEHAFNLFVRLNFKRNKN